MVPPSLWFENKILVQGSQVDVETAGQVASTSEMNPGAQLVCFLFSPRPRPMGWRYPHLGWVFSHQLTQAVHSLTDRDQGESSEEL